jgi:hypothetical protein
MIGVADMPTRHQWRCPVIMKTRPECIAYTCALCGAIAVLGDRDESLSMLPVLSSEPSGSNDPERECIPLPRTPRMDC